MKVHVETLYSIDNENAHTEYVQLKLTKLWFKNFAHHHIATVG